MAKPAAGFGLHCRRPQPDRQRKGDLCWSCVTRRRDERRLDRVYAVVGDACWLCGYTRGAAGRRVLDFHHVEPSQKQFTLDRRNAANLSWCRVAAELRKCVLLCANCHREVEAKLVEAERIATLHADQWSSARLEQLASSPYGRP